MSLQEENCEAIVIQCIVKVKENDEESGQQMAPLVKTWKSENVGSKSKGFFLLKASLTAMWLPAVVGDQEGVFLVTVIRSSLSP